MSRLWESNPSPLECQTYDRSLRDLVCDTLKEGCDKRFSQGVLPGLELCPYFRGDTLQKIPLLLEGLLQSCINGLRVLAQHPGHDYQQRLPPL